MLNQDNNLSTRSSEQARLLVQHPAQLGLLHLQERTGNFPKVSWCVSDTTPRDTRNSQGMAAKGPRLILA